MSPLQERPTLDQYFMEMTQLVKARGTCPRRQVGAVVVKDKRVLTTGYNGAPRNFPHPMEVGCLRDELQVPRGMMADICPCLHAEQNAILQAATTGVNIEGADLYCTTQPCTQCSRMIANCGIRRVVFLEGYPDPLAIGILTTAGVTMWQYEPQAKAAKRLEGLNTFEQAQDELRRRWKSGEARLPMASPGAPVVPDLTANAAREAAVGVAATDPDAEQDPDFQDGERAAPPAAGTTPIRDLRDDPRRAELLRRMAQEKVERRRRLQGGEPEA